MRINSNCSVLQKHKDKKSIPSLVDVLNLEVGEEAALSSNNETLLHSFLRKKFTNPSFVVKLLELGYKVDSLDNYNQTPLYYAIRTRSVEICSVLIENGANVNHKDFTGSTPLHAAAAVGSIDICRLLVHGGAELNIENDFEATPLKIACEEANLKCARYLIDMGSTFNDDKKWLYGGTNVLYKNGKIFHG